MHYSHFFIKVCLSHLNIDIKSALRVNLLKIEISQLNIIWETARNGDLFPHLYDHLPLSSVVAEHHLGLSADGDHIVPEAFLYQS